MIKTILTLLTSTALVATSYGTITGGSITSGPPGSFFQKLTVPIANPLGTPNTVGNNTFNTNNLYGFDEDQNVTLLANLAYELGSFALPGAGNLLAGTVVASHYVFFDPLNNTNLKGTVDFDSKIIAIMTSRSTLLASDVLANTGVTYLNPGLRGLEPVDTVTISSANQIRVDFTASSPGDYIRVLTEHSPAAVPDSTSSAALLGLSLITLVSIRRRMA